MLRTSNTTEGFRQAVVRAETTGNSATSSWRDTLPVHPAAELFPLMGEEELRELADDIKKDGLIEAIIIYKNSVLDGRNRLDALALIGREYDDAHFHNLPDDDPEFDPAAFVISKNIRRRHLTSEQKNDLVARLLRNDPEKSDRQIAKIVGRDNKTVVKVRTKLEGREEIPHVEIRADTKGRKPR